MPLLPATNADGLPIVPMTDEQKYLFDLKGWLILPDLLSQEQVAAVREHQMKFLYERDKLPPNQRDHHGGPSQVMLDHPVIVGIFNEILGNQGLATEECYGFRYDHTWTSHRKTGNDAFNPHGGGGLLRLPGNTHTYHMQPGKIHAGLCRVVWEINDVEHGKGGTLFLSGSHKTAFPQPKSLVGRDSKLWETYECRAGSALVFTESLCHTGTTWTSTRNDRLTLFTCYNDVCSKWGGPGNNGRVPDEVIQSMPPKRQSLFRGVWYGMGTGKGINHYYSPDNHAI